MPSHQWVPIFLNRHKDLSNRMASNIKRSRAAVSHEKINSFFDHFVKEAENVPAENIFNYDETNLTDDPGCKKKYIFKRGIKYPEVVRDTSKTSISIMFCGSAGGQFLAPYVVYKGGDLWSSWCQSTP